MIDALRRIVAGPAGRDHQTIFRRLIRGALAITIATEAEWVVEVWEDDENEPSAYRLLETVLGHIEAAAA